MLPAGAATPPTEVTAATKAAANPAPSIALGAQTTWRGLKPVQDLELGLISCAENPIYIIVTNKLVAHAQG